MASGSVGVATRSDTLVLVICVALSMVALWLPPEVQEPVASAIRRSLLAPVLAVERRAAEAREAGRSVLRLRAARDSLALAAAFVPELVTENARLRAMLDLGPRVAARFVPAEVLHRGPLSDALTLALSAGRNSGVAPFQAVIVPEGLVGVIQVADPATSIALAWTHPDFRASAMTDQGSAVGIVAARRGPLGGEIMEFRGVPYRERLSAGTRVATSGLGGVFPRGITLGTIVGVLRETAGWERTYLVRPAVHPAQVTHVLVLVGP